MTNFMLILKIVFTGLMAANLAASVFLMTNRPESYTLFYYFGDIISVATLAWLWTYRPAAPAAS